MGFYDHEDTVETYIQMAEGYDGRLLVAVLKQQLPAGSTVLELGMGPGKDLPLLEDHFSVTGSDVSAIFLQRYRKNHPAADLLLLDAVTLETERHFDAIYSNKVLHHLTANELQESFQRQAELLNPNGLLLHTFWYGTGMEKHQGLRFSYYTEASLRAVVGPAFDIIAAVRYAEIEDGDSLYLLLRHSASSLGLWAGSGP